MYQQITYTKSTNKAQPVRITGDFAAYYDKESNTFLWDMNAGEEQELKKGETTFQRLEIKPAAESEYQIDYKRRGAKNHGVITVAIRNQAGEVVDDIEWIVYRGYTGYQTRLFTEGKKAETVFALAEEDAYMFCTADPCLECNYACLVGMEIYAYSKKEGIIVDGFKKILRQQGKDELNIARLF